jgi:hypothetical protein
MYINTYPKKNKEVFEKYKIVQLENSIALNSKTRNWTKCKRDKDKGQK